MSKEEFLKSRKRGLGGSDIAAIMGLSPWRTPLDVYLDKTSDEVEDNTSEAQERGNSLEPYVLAQYEKQTGSKLFIKATTFKDQEYPFLIGNVDAIVADSNIVVEAKTSAVRRWESIPEYYKLQCAHYAYITNADRVDICVMFSDLKCYIYTYWRDGQLEKQIKTAAIDFWNNYILKLTPPPFQNVKDFDKIYPFSNIDISIIADTVIEGHIKTLLNVQSNIKDLERVEDALKLQIMQYMGEAEKLCGSSINNVIATLKTYSRSDLDRKKLKQDHPEIYEEYQKTSNYRMLKFKGKEE